MNNPRKFKTIEDELFFKTRLEEIYSEFPSLAKKIAPEYYIDLERNDEVEDPSTIVFGMHKLINEYSEFRNGLEKQFDPQKSKCIQQRIYLLNHCLSMEKQTNEIIVEAVKLFKADFTAQLGELNKLLVSNFRKSNDLPTYPKIIMGHLAAILVKLKTEKESPVFGFTKIKLATVAFLYFRDKNGKKFENKKSFCSMLYQLSKYSNNEFKIVKLQLEAMSMYIKDM